MNKKIVTIIPDIHGRDTWRNINSSILNNPYNHIIFLGDYVDSFHLTDQQIYDELEAIIVLKIAYPEQVTLLIGNHDVQYVFDDYHCSGYRSSMSMGLHKLFNENKDLFQLTYQLGDYIFSHAGISKMWLREFKALYRSTYTITSKDFDDNFVNIINLTYKGRFLNPDGKLGLLADKLFAVSSTRGGSDNYSGLVWADLKETKEDYLDSFHQIVGHTPVEFIATVGNKKSSITYTDCHRDRPDFLTKVITYE